jgi:hypothetical protein
MHPGNDDIGLYRYHNPISIKTPVSDEAASSFQKMSSGGFRYCATSASCGGSWLRG